jgi:hypothetical protein
MGSHLTIPGIPTVTPPLLCRLASLLQAHLGFNKGRASARFNNHYRRVLRVGLLRWGDLHQPDHSWPRHMLRQQQRLGACPSMGTPVYHLVSLWGLLVTHRGCTRHNRFQRPHNRLTQPAPTSGGRATPTASTHLPKGHIVCPFFGPFWIFSNMALF